jgi:RimJ/RimL family protein N-acetyltransferase
LITAAYTSPSETARENQIVGSFVCNGVWGDQYAIDKFCAMAVFDGDKLIAGTLYHNYHPKEGVIELTSYSTSKRWLTKPVINAMFNLPFVRLGCQLVVLRVSERNENMVRIARLFGFTETYIPRLRGRDEGEFIFQYTDDQWASSKYNGGA